MTARRTMILATWRPVAVAVAMALGIGSGSARGQETDSLISPAGSTQKPILFDSDAPLRLRFEGALRELLDDRDSIESKEHAFAFTYQVGDAPPVPLPAELKTRGHWRRQERHCDYPPLRLNVPRGKVDETLFAGQDKLKLVTPCRPSIKGYEEYVLREYLVYKVYNLLTPLSLRVRLATTTYVDTTRRRDSLTTHTFLLEEPEEMAARNNGTVMGLFGAEFEHVDSVQMGLVGVFLYMIGQTDWSLRGLHNIELVQQQGSFFPVAYDFDFTGIVNTVYARPDPRLRLRSVRERLYRGACLSETHWATVLATFQDQKAAIYALYDSLPGLSSGYVKDTRGYLDDFYEVLDDPGKTSKELLQKCRAAEGI